MESVALLADISKELYNDSSALTKRYEIFLYLKQRTNRPFTFFNIENIFKNKIHSTVSICARVKVMVYSCPAITYYHS